MHRAIFEAAQKTGFCIAVQEANIIKGYKDEIVFVKVPIGFPVWRHWTQVQNSSTYHVVDAYRGKMWLFRHRIFKSKSLTHGLLKAREPWFHNEVKILQTCVPLSTSPSRTDQTTTLQPMTCSSLRSLREKEEYVPLGAEVIMEDIVVAPNAVPVHVSENSQSACVEEGYPVYPEWSRCD